MKLSEFTEAHSDVMRLMDENGSSEAIRNLITSQFGDCLCAEDLERLVSLSCIVFASGFVAGYLSGDETDLPDAQEDADKGVFGFAIGQC